MFESYAVACSRGSCVTCRASVRSVGGVRRPWGTYCTRACDAIGWRALVDFFGEERVELGAHELRAKGCPHCRGEGPLGVRFGTRATSFVIGCATTTTRHLGCEACTRRRLREDLVHTVLLGFWSFFGIVMGPIALWQTVRELRQPANDEPWEALRETVLDELFGAHLRAIAAQPPQPKTLVTPLATVGGGWT